MGSLGNRGRSGRPIRLMEGRRTSNTAMGGHYSRTANGMSTGPTAIFTVSRPVRERDGLRLRSCGDGDGANRSLGKGGVTFCMTRLLAIISGPNSI